MIATLWLKIQGYVYAFAAIVVAIGAAILYGRSKGVASEQAKTDAAEQDAQVAHQQNAILESRHDTDTQVQSLPEAPPQAVATADPNTAAGKLRDITRD